MYCMGNVLPIKYRTKYSMFYTCAYHLRYYRWFAESLCYDLSLPLAAQAESLADT